MTKKARQPKTNVQKTDKKRSLTDNKETSEEVSVKPATGFFDVVRRYYLAEILFIFVIISFICYYKRIPWGLPTQDGPAYLLVAKEITEESSIVEMYQGRPFYMFFTAAFNLLVKNVLYSGLIANYLMALVAGISLFFILTRYCSRYFALLGVLLTILQPFFIFQARNTMSVMSALAFTNLSLLLILIFFERFYAQTSNGRTGYVPFFLGVCIGLMVASHPPTVFNIMAMGLILGLEWIINLRKRRNFFRDLLIIGLSAAFVGFVFEALIAYWLALKKFKGGLFNTYFYNFFYWVGRMGKPITGDISLASYIKALLGKNIFAYMLAGLGTLILPAILWKKKKLYLLVVPLMFWPILYFGPVKFYAEVYRNVTYSYPFFALVLALGVWGISLPITKVIDRTIPKRANVCKQALAALLLVFSIFFCFHTYYHHMGLRKPTCWQMLNRISPIYDILTRIKPNRKVFVQDVGFKINPYIYLSSLLPNEVELTDIANTTLLEKGYWVDLVVHPYYDKIAFEYGYEPSVHEHLESNKVYNLYDVKTSRDYLQPLPRLKNPVEKLGLTPIVTINFENPEQFKNLDSNSRLRLSSVYGLEGYKTGGLVSWEEKTEAEVSLKDPLDMRHPFTILFWVKLFYKNEIFANLFQETDARFQFNVFGRVIRQPYKVNFSFNNGNTNIYSKRPIEISKYNLVALTYNGQTLRLYLNDPDPAEMVVGTQLIQSLRFSGFTIGKQLTRREQMPFAIDCLNVLDRPLSPPEIAKLVEFQKENIP